MLLAIFLPRQQRGFARYIAAVALGQHVLAQRADVLPGDDARADGRLDRHLELLPRDQLLELRGHGQTVLAGVVRVHDLAERVYRLALQQDVDLDQVGLLLAVGLVVQRRVAAGPGLEVVEEVEDDLGQRQHVADLHPVRGQVVHADQRTAPALAQLHDRADVLGRGDHRRAYHRLVDAIHLALPRLPASPVIARVHHPELPAGVPDEAGG